MHFSMTNRRPSWLLTAALIASLASLAFAQIGVPPPPKNKRAASTSLGQGFKLGKRIPASPRLPQRTIQTVP